MAYTVSIPSYRSGKPVVYEIVVDLGQAFRPYTISRRYNEFLALAKDVETELGEPVAVAPPPKPGIWVTVDNDKRRADLESMLMALVRIPDFAESLTVCNFLEIYQHRSAQKNEGTTVDWIHVTAEVSRHINEARFSQHTSKMRQHIIQSKTLIGQLQRNINDSSVSLGSGERSRRQQQVDNFLQNIQQLEANIGSDSSTYASSRITQVQPPRVLGETDKTRKLNNRGLLQYQQQVVDDQDVVIEDLRLAVSRQKELGLAIHSEISKQNELLDELDLDVHRVNSKLNEARRKTANLDR